MATKNIIAELNKGEKLNGDNYNIWQLKMHYVLEEQDALEAITKVLVQPVTSGDNANLEQFKRDMDAYNAWKKKDSNAKGILISSMNDDLVFEHQHHPTAQAMWLALKEKFGGISISKLRQLTIKFDTYKKVPNKFMKQHLRDMSNMITELKSVGSQLTDEQQV